MPRTQNDQVIALELEHRWSGFETDSQYLTNHGASQEKKNKNKKQRAKCCAWTTY